MKRTVLSRATRWAESISVDRNYIAAPVVWKETERVGALAGRLVRLHFKLRACKLYTFQFVYEE